MATTKPPQVLAGRLTQIASDVSSGHNPSSISLELLLDTFLALYTDCRAAANQTEHIVKFVQKYDKVAARLQKLRVNTQDFDVVKVLATGAIGKVCLVKGKMDDKVYAMKVLKKLDLLTRREAAFFMEERNVLVFAQTSKWLTTLYAAFQDEENLYLVMDYVSGGSLRSLIMSRDDPMPEQEAKFYVAEILLSLEELHSYNYVHRDVKPENMLIDETGHVKLADFGSCMILDEADKITSHETVGTPDYISPEILRALEGGVSYGKECDWWSLGIILFELLFDETPFYAESLTETYGKIMDHENTFAFPDDCEISAEAKDIISRLLCSKERRLGCNGVAEIKAHPWFNGIDFEQIRSHKPPFVPELDGPEDTKYFENEEDESKKFAVKKLAKDREFTGQNLNFVGYTYLQNARPIVSFGGDLVLALGSGGDSSGRIQSLEDEIDALKARLQAEVTNVAAAQTAVRAAEEHVKAIKAKLAKESAHRQELTERSLILEKDKMDMQAELSDLRLLKTDATHEKEELEAKLAQVKRSLDADLKARSEIQELQEVNAKLEDELSSLRSGLERESASSKQKEAALAELTRKKTLLDVELQQMTRKMQDEVNGRSAAESKASQLLQEVSDQQSKVLNLSKERVQLTERVHILSTENSNLQESLRKEQAAVEETTQRSSQLEQAKAGVEAELDALQKTIDTLQSERDALASSSKAYSGDAQSLGVVNKQLETAVTARSRANDELASVNKRKAVLEVEVAELRKKLRMQEEATIETKAKNISLQTHLAEITSKLAVIDDTNQRLSKHISSSSEESKGLTLRHSSELSTLKASLQESAARLDEVEKTKRLLETDLEQARKREAEMSDNYKKLEGRLAEVESAVAKERKSKFGYEALFQAGESARDELQREVERLHSRMAFTKEEHTKSVREYQDSLFRVRTEYAALEERHDAETKLRSRLEEDISRLAKEIAALQGQIKIDKQKQLDAEQQILTLSEKLLEGRERERKSVEVPDAVLEKWRHGDGKSSLSVPTTEKSRKNIGKLFLSRGSPTKDVHHRGVIYEAGEEDPLSMQSSPLGSQNVNELSGSHRRMSTASSQGSLKSSNTMLSDVPTIHLQEDMRGWIKVPKGGKVKKGWVAKFAVVTKDHKLTLYDREKDAGTSEPTESYDICGDIFVVKPVKQSELIHASGTHIDFIFQIQTQPKSGVVPSTSLAFANSSSSAGVSPTEKQQSAHELHKRAAKLSQDISQKEKVLSAAERLLGVSSSSTNYKQIETEVVTLQEQLHLLRADMQAVMDQLQHVGPVETGGDAAVLDAEFLEELAICKREYEKEITIEENKRTALLKMREPLIQARPKVKHGLFGSTTVNTPMDAQRAEVEGQLQAIEKRLGRLREDIGTLTNASTRDAQKKIVNIFMKKNRIEEWKNHKFKLRQYNKPVSCMQCTQPMWGVNQGYECTACKMVVHVNCISCVQQTCQDIANTKNLVPSYFMTGSQNERDNWIANLEASRREVDKLKSPTSFVGNLGNIASSSSSITSSPLSSIPESSSVNGIRKIPLPPLV
ncbi:hypothetical protein SeMB42_g05848 [Synchytrium endobioticum]|uniref:non-specific serine/threonine protein kinase n=1 Tax=Synchytrium endobioticum TaxID=286115 RepID=A0A507CYC9_9FUNG|nr:hypothetical protein SeMB42_g05848 [Synchytrium endobioticum]TPX44164.1 hypothetical protein SeLEV6574_g04670 [Synchytrium endobioticum]